ncbi:MAG: type II toxin-antitoxin system RelE/ParE family toxin [Candidatus Ancillula sp.]|jgi:mRNA interferase RelE/StbE|nr:type II toxin-antitoxin system RelE/ParE family toxin [Candidatus Ancillula sp.]
MSLYKVKINKHCLKQFKRLDKQTAVRIQQWLFKNVHNSENPRQHGKALVGERRDQWRYRVGNYRIICRIEDEELIVLALKVAHRKEVYKK